MEEEVSMLASDEALGARPDRREGVELREDGDDIV